MSPNIGTTNETHNLKLRPETKNIQNSKNGSPLTPPDSDVTKINQSNETPVPIKDRLIGKPVSSHLSADQVTEFLTKEGTIIS